MIDKIEDLSNEALETAVAGAQTYHMKLTVGGTDIVGETSNETGDGTSNTVLLGEKLIVRD